MARPGLPSWCSTGAAILSLGSCAAWLVGRAAGDAWWWSQWLFWIPSAAVLLLALAALALGSLVGRAGRKSGLVLQVVVALLALIALLRNDLGFRVREPAITAETVHVLQWNTNWPSSDDSRSAQALADTPADIVLISNRGAITSPDRVRLWAGPDARVVGAGPFALVTRWPVREAIQIAGGGGAGKRWWVARFEVLPPMWRGTPMRIAMVDLPSRPTLSRAAVAEALWQACDEGSLGDVDLVAGDFNATDGSVILSRCFPTFRDALQVAGRGWLATWPRRFPMWRIDHVLVSASIEPLQGRTIDPGISSHRMTEVRLRKREPGVTGSAR
jgi:endonuclease/exonuclease/phosphatase (EEP) superfamily protein YafD